MRKTILLKISSEADRVTVAGILLRNGYRVEMAKRKQSKSYQYFLKCELLDGIVLQNSEGAEDDS